MVSFDVFDAGICLQHSLVLLFFKVKLKVIHSELNSYKEIKILFQNVYIMSIYLMSVIYRYELSFRRI